MQTSEGNKSNIAPETGTVAAGPESDTNSMKAVQTRALTKVYPKKGDFTKLNKVADGVTFHIGATEVFSLLGPNGAGKSTVHSMLCGKTNPSDGDAFIFNHSIVSNMSDAQRHTGVCPQFDTWLFEFLTGS